MNKELKGYLMSGVYGIGTGLLIVAAFALMLMMLAKTADAHDTVRTYDARLGEQDRSMNYRLVDTVEGHVEYVVLEVNALVTFQCEETNLYLTALMENIAKHIAADPTNGYMYKGALLTIREAWCDAE